MNRSKATKRKPVTQAEMVAVMRRGAEHFKELLAELRANRAKGD